MKHHPNFTKAGRKLRGTDPIAYRKLCEEIALHNRIELVKKELEKFAKNA